MAVHIKTPLIESLGLATSGQQIHLKLENTQPSGSFKARGIGYACERYVKEGADTLLASSGGNAGLAVAYAGRKLGVAVTVFVPETTSETAKDLIRREGANVEVAGASWAESHRAALEKMDKGMAYLHPFDDPLIWEGHASLVEEIAAERQPPDAIVLSVGGGGLLCGVVQGLRAVGWDGVPVVAVETRGCDSLAQSHARPAVCSLER